MDKEEYEGHPHYRYPPEEIVNDLANLTPEILETINKARKNIISSIIN